MDGVTPDLLTQLLAGEWPRFWATLVLTPLVVQMLKPYLPTGRKAVRRGEPVENRWAFLCSVAVSLVLNVGPALYLTYGQSDLPAQNLWGSVALGLAGGIIPAGTLRGIRLTVDGDRTERVATEAVERAALAEAALEQVTDAPARATD